MSKFIAALAAILSNSGLSSPLQACPVPVPFNPNWARTADVVLVGRIVGRELVIDQKATDQLRRMHLSRDERHVVGPNWSPKRYKTRLVISVDQVLKGAAPKQVVVFAGGGLFERSRKMPVAAQLIGAQFSVGTGASAAAKQLWLTANSCGGSFLMDANGQQAKAVRKVLSTQF